MLVVTGMNRIRSTRVIKKFSKSRGTRVGTVTAKSGYFLYKKGTEISLYSVYILRQDGISADCVTAPVVH
jgi:hypothetical protein